MFKNIDSPKRSFSEKIVLFSHHHSGGVFGCPTLLCRENKGIREPFLGVRR
jgi:hypothetical protein